MPRATKRDLIIELSNQSGQTHFEVEKSLDMFLDAITRHLEKGEGVVVRGFGTLDIRVAKSKIGRNPKRPGSEKLIPDRCVVRFRPSRELKEKVALVPVETIRGEARTDDQQE